MMTFPEFEKQMRKTVSDADYQDIAEAYGRYFKDNVKVGDGATIHYWSDAHAGTVVKKTAKTLTIRQDKATLAEDWKPEFIPGGFAAHCINQNEQRWTYEPNENGCVYVAYWSEKKCGYYSHGLHVTPGRHEFYDYNF